MPAEPYPLEAARSLRAREEDAAKETVALRLADATGAEQACARAEAAVREHQRETREVELRERALDAAGRTIAESLRATAFAERRRAEELALRARLDCARQAELEARAALDHAREALARARAEREAVERHYEAWLSDRRKRAQVREDDDAEDVVAARRLRTK